MSKKIKYFFVVSFLLVTAVIVHATTVYLSASPQAPTEVQSFAINWNGTNWSVSGGSVLGGTGQTYVQDTYGSTSFGYTYQGTSTFKDSFTLSGYSPFDFGIQLTNGTGGLYATYIKL